MAQVVPKDPKLREAEVWRKGRRFEDFEVGASFEHHWGRTVTEAEAVQFASVTLSFNPLYFNREYALAAGHRDIVVTPMLVFLVVFGLTVEDLSEGGAGAFLGVDDLTHTATVYPGDTLSAASTVEAARSSRGRPDFGVVTWHTRGTNQAEQTVIDFRRSNLVSKRSAAGNEL